MIFIGVDPGAKGYISVLYDDGSYEGWPMPIRAEDGEIDSEELYGIFEKISSAQEEAFYAVEEVHAIYGSSAGSTFSFGYNVGVLHSAMSANGIRFELIQPKAWQAEMWRDQTKFRFENGKKKGKVDTKTTSIQAAMNLYPEVDLRRTKRARVADDGKADSLLIAGMLKRFHLGY